MDFAGRLALRPGDANAYSNLVVRLQLVTDSTLCRALIERFALVEAVALPAWQRLASLTPADPAIQCEAANAFYLMGYDADALRFVDQALAIDGHFITAWELKAALTENAGERRAVLEHILKIDPGNRYAVDHLIVMGRPGGT